MLWGYQYLSQMSPAEFPSDSFTGDQYNINKLNKCSPCVKSNAQVFSSTTWIVSERKNTKLECPYVSIQAVETKV